MINRKLRIVVTFGGEEERCMHRGAQRRVKGTGIVQVLNARSVQDWLILLLSITLLYIVLIYFTCIRYMYVISHKFLKSKEKRDHKIHSNWTNEQSQLL